MAAVNARRPSIPVSGRYNPALACFYLVWEAVESRLESCQSEEAVWEVLDDVNEMLGLPRGTRRHGVSYREMRERLKDINDRRKLVRRW